jgi:hypothetical protein
VEKFERDFFARMETPAPRRTIDDGMKKLPADNFRGPVSWPSPTAQSKPSAKR